MSTFKLASGSLIPAIGFGTGTKWFKLGRDEIDEKLITTVANAIKLGFNHIDGAEIYNTDNEIGQAIIRSGVDRKSLWITDKYFSGDGTYSNRSPQPNPYEALKADLARFKLDYVDLYLIHTPFITKDTHGFTLIEAWKYVEKLHEEGLAKNIGVSNFAVEHIQQILDSKPKYLPLVNQIEFSPYLQNQTPGIVEFSQKHGILVEAYGPLAPLTKAKPGPLDSLLEKLTKKYSRSDTQILLRWVIQKGVLPITTSSNEKRLTEILDVYNFKLEDSDVEEITKVGQQKHFRQFFTELEDYKPKTT